MNAKKKEPIVVLDEGQTPEILASAIKDVADAAKKLLSTRLTKRAILVLLKDMSGQPMHVIESILDNAASLDRFIKK